MLIEREAALKAVHEAIAEGKSWYSALSHLPSAEKTGKWIVHTDKFANGAEYFGYATCSECGEMFYTIDTIGNTPIWDYCPYCGARMVE